MIVYDDVVPLEQNNQLYNKLLYDTAYYYGEKDRIDTPKNGFTSEINKDDELFKMLCEIIFKKNPRLKEKECQRSYVNLVLPKEKLYFHQDGDVTTFLFYFNPIVTYDEGGETQFIINNELISVLPVPSRMIEFDGMIWHKATSFMTIPRISVALKFYY